MMTFLDFLIWLLLLGILFFFLGKKESRINVKEKEKKKLPNLHSMQEEKTITQKTNAEAVTCLLAWVPMYTPPFSTERGAGDVENAGGL